MLQTTWIALLLGFWSSLYLIDAFLKVSYNFFFCSSEFIALKQFLLHGYSIITKTYQIVASLKYRNEDLFTKMASRFFCWLMFFVFRNKCIFQYCFRPTTFQVTWFLLGKYFLFVSVFDPFSISSKVRRSYVVSEQTNARTCTLTHT